ncbi:hypothetical protein TNCV_3449701 [Trichonephila clavipes]|nr:hypothetical protein TNCV_3449701 [Trichonephila clavipes]
MIWDALRRLAATKIPFITVQQVYEFLVVYYWDTYERREIDEQKHITQSQKNTDFITNDDPSKEQKRYATFLSRRKSIAGEGPISFPVDTSMPYSGFQPEPTRWQAECQNHHTGCGVEELRTKEY